MLLALSWGLAWDRGAWGREASFRADFISVIGCIIGVLRFLVTPGLSVSRAMQLQGYACLGLHIPEAAPAVVGGMKEHWGDWRNIPWAYLSGPVLPAL